MSVQVKFSAIKQTRWYEYLIRFLFGGLITAAAGFITHQYGPVVGGLFLAFPSIFPASVTLVQTHKERQEKKQGTGREERKTAGHETAGMTAEGAVFGSVGLLGFAIIIWLYSVQLAPWLVLVLAQVIWLVVSVLAWRVFSKAPQRGEQ